MSDWYTLLLGDDGSAAFIAECALRAVLMFLGTLALMKLTGKKEVRQFSLLELLVIIGLGSALGDPMIYSDSPVLPSLTAIATTLFCYWGVNRWASRFPAVKQAVSGRVRRVLYDGVIDLRALEHEGLAADELFAELRVQHVEHLGQVEAAYMEVDGELSIFFRSDADVRPGLPIRPEHAERALSIADLHAGSACCARCGYRQRPVLYAECPLCHGKAWQVPSDTRRLT